MVKEAKKRGAGHNSKEALLADLDSQAVAQLLADKWNRECAVTVGGRHVRFLKGFALNFVNRPHNDSKWLAAEVALPESRDGFQKFNNNAGFVDVRDEAEAANCFSHWTWDVTNGEATVLDMQGVVEADGCIVCTDAQVQHRDRHRYGRGNLGDRGVGAFFAAHRCGPMCKSLKLRRPGELVAMPTALEVGIAVTSPTVVATLIPEPTPVVAEEHARPMAANGAMWKPGEGRSISRPSWVADSDVYRCQVRTAPQCQRQGGSVFGLFRRRHHCRSCGNVTCSACSKGKLPLPFEVPGTLHRVCDTCAKRFTGAMGSE